MSCDIIKTPCTVPLKGRVSFSEEVTFVEIEDYDDEWEHEAWFQVSIRYSIATFANNRASFEPLL